MTPPRISRWLFAFAFLLTATYSLAQSKPVDYAAIDAYIEKHVKAYNLPGMAVGIIHEGEVVFSKGYGVRTVGTTDSMTANSIFGIASCSKAFTAAGIALLVQEGKLKWDDKVVDHLPGFQLNDPYVTKEITIRDLLTHRSGLATFDGDLLWYRTHYSRSEVVERIRHLPLKNGFRNEFGYQNVMYIAAGLIIEEISGKTWDDFMKDRFLKPIKMTATTTSITEFSSEMELATPHLENQPQVWANYDNAGPAAGLNSNVTDLLKWADMWLNEGKAGDKKILSKNSIRELWGAQTNLPVSSFDEVNGTNFKAYAMGWKTYDYSGKKVVEHDGGVPGFISKVCMVPGKKLGIVILSNDMTWLNTALNYRIMDQFLNEKTRDWAGEFLEYYNRQQAVNDESEAKRLSPPRKRKKPTLKYVADYAGTYTDKMYGDIKITESNGTLKLKMLPSEEVFSGKLEHWKNDVFLIQFEDPFLPQGFIRFEVDEEAKTVTGFTIDLPNPDLHFSNLKFKKAG